MSICKIRNLTTLITYVSLKNKAIEVWNLFKFKVTGHCHNDDLKI